MEIPPFVKKHQMLIVGGIVVVVVFVAYEMLTSSSSAAAASSATDPSIDPATGVSYAVEEQQQQESDASAAATAQNATAAQAEADANTQATNQLNASIQATQQQTEVAAVSAIGQTVSSIDTASAAIPVAAINAAASQNQAALLGAAQVSSNANAAIPGIIQGAGQVLAAVNAPFAQYGAAVGSSAGVQAVNSLGNNLASSEQASASVANSASSAAARETASNNQTVGEVGTIAAIALL
jgi:hypothetical protein